jgi:hypothetical protein
MFAVAIAVVAAGGLNLVGSSALHEGGASIPAGWQSGSSDSGDGGSGHSYTEDGGEGAEDSTTDFAALNFVLFLLPLVSRLLCTLYDPSRPSTIYGSVLEWPD